jgi:hypothetical protein
LVQFRPVYELPATRRKILLPPDLQKIMRGEVPHEFPALGCADLISKFLQGHTLRVSQKNRRGWKIKKAAQPQLERLEGYDEIWVLCFREPGSGWRLIGRFIETDTLVILRVANKSDIGGTYEEVVLDVMEKWNNYFPSTDAHAGNWIDGYISGEHYDVDQDYK